MELKSASGGLIRVRMMSEIYKKLAEIQQALNAPKGQWNDFSNFHYRSCEDILEALKPLLGDYSVTLSDEMVMLGERFYVKATAALRNEGASICMHAFAREAENKKGMDSGQLTGATSSYARKYALNGLFLIDDNKDADSHDNSEPSRQKTTLELGAGKASAGQAEELEKPWYNDFDKHKDMMREQISGGQTTPDQIMTNLCDRYKVNKDVRAKIKGLANEQ